MRNLFGVRDLEIGISFISLGCFDKHGMPAIEGGNDGRRLHFGRAFC